MTQPATTPFTDAAVEAIFDAYPDHVRPHLLALRQLVFDTAAAIDGVGTLEETLRWGEPSYLTSASRTGTTIRIDWKARAADQYAMYFVCHTNLVSTFRALYADRLSFEKNRAIVFDLHDPFPSDIVAHCIAMALTYHRDKANNR